MQTQGDGYDERSRINVVPARHIASLVHWFRLQNAPLGSLAYGALHWHVCDVESHVAEASPPGPSAAGRRERAWHNK